MDIIQTKQKSIFPTIPNNGNEIKLTEDGLVTKIILSQGKTDSSSILPMEGYDVEILVEGYLLDGTQVENETDINDPLSFTLGQSSVISGWEIGLLTMKIGEQALFTIQPKYNYGNAGCIIKNIPKESTIKYYIQLLNINTTPHYDLPLDQILKKAEKQKELGNQAYKKGDYKRALNKYQKAIDLTLGDGEQQTILKLLCWNNIAQVYLQQKDYELAKEFAFKVIERQPSNVKALNRISQAYIAQENYEESINYLNLALEEEPNNKSINEQLQNILQKQCSENQKQKGIYSQLFNAPLLEQNQYDEEYKNQNVQQINKNIEMIGNPLIYFDIVIEDSNPQRIVIELFKNTPVNTELKFQDFYKSYQKFKNSMILFVIKQEYLVVGSCDNLNLEDNQSQEIKNQQVQQTSSQKHLSRGLVSIHNSGQNIFNSQFLLTFGQLPKLDDTNIIIGQIKHNIEFLDVVENVEVQENFKPLKLIKIIDCGEMQKQ